MSAVASPGVSGTKPESSTILNSIIPDGHSSTAQLSRNQAQAPEAQKNGRSLQPTSMMVKTFTLVKNQCLCGEPLGVSTNPVSQ